MSGRVTVQDTRRTVPHVSILTPLNPHSRTGGRCIVLAERGYRSKWTKLVCFCRHQRKDVTCKTLDQIAPLLSHPERVRFEHDTRAADRSTT